MHTAVCCFLICLRTTTHALSVYDTALYEQSYITQLCDHFVRLLHAIIIDTTQPVCSLPIMTEEELSLLRDDFSYSEAHNAEHLSRLEDGIDTQIAMHACQHPGAWRSYVTLNVICLQWTVVDRLSPTAVRRSTTTVGQPSTAVGSF